MRKVIFLAGAAGSGLTTLAAALAASGFETAHPSSPHGPNERIAAGAVPAIGAFNRALLALAGHRPDRIPLTLDFASLAPASLTEWAGDALLPGARAALAADIPLTRGHTDSAGGGGIVCQDAGFAFTLPLWLRVAQEAGLSCAVVIVHRSAVALTGALQRQWHGEGHGQAQGQGAGEREGQDFAAATSRIMDTWLALLAAAPAGTPVVSYEAFTADPAGTLASLGLESRAVEEGTGARVPTAPDLGFIRSARPLPPLPRPLLPAPLRAFDQRLAEAHGTAPEGGPVDPAQVAAETRRRASEKSFAGHTLLLGAKDLLAAAPLFAPPAEAPLPETALREAARIAAPLPIAAPAALAAAPPLAPAPLGAPATLRTPAPRPVIVHCHIFKNAGSSVDVVLKEHFGARWVTHEFPTRNGLSNADLTHAYLRAHTGLDVLSTHTGDWWLGHDGNGLTVLPIIFLRHPLLRIRSAYSFEKKQAADTLGARLAKANDFPGYVKARLDRPNDLAFRDFQAHRLAAYEARLTADLYSTAMRALDRAPFIGLVEDFAGSAARLDALIAPHFPGFKAYSARANTTDSSDATPGEKLARIREELGEEVHDELSAANRVDFALHDAAMARWPAAAPPPAHRAAAQ